MVKTGTATEAVTIAAVTSAALALIINSLMLSLLLGNKRCTLRTCYQKPCKP